MLELFPVFQYVHVFLEALARRACAPQTLLSIAEIVLLAFLFFNFLGITVAFLVWLERKISARMQYRLGPMYVGPFQGILQTVADAVKLILKEDVIPRDADRWMHRAAPIVTFVPAFACFAVLPFGVSLVMVHLDVSLLYILAVSGLSSLGLLMAGWASGNKFSALGGLRAAAQMVSYEIPRLMAAVIVVLQYGTLDLARIAAGQSEGRWFIFHPIGFAAFVIFLICSVAETNRTPFDLPEAESELVAGFHTEYSGMKFSLFFLAEYAYVFLASALCAVLFLGGGDGIGLPSWIWFLLKCYAVIFLFMWFRWTFPRLRVDRLMLLCWRYLFPWSLALIALMGGVIALR